ncbi:hypothetical protein PSA7680_01974 [Pseudoruegeria aquimaris]|uniref:Uncharacterized protein n=1 Tax=Pseudoruegeria aquimaris TaxID=393663 RepID=A0A1Y5SKM5_9RHOB|nr:hypothetical protein [Pseudoruegeria aquimaris]SLN39851.1 hypothetical protein PSA7680_01974 [Pseudoruegeria aquimaris]
MTGGPASLRRWLWPLLALWLGCQIWAVSQLWEAPTGDGFTRGMNRITGFLAGQLVAGLLAIFCWQAGSGGGSRLARWAARLPALVALAWVLGIAGLIGWAWITHPGP